MSDQSGTISRVKEMIEESARIVVMLGVGTVIESGGENLWSSRECYRHYNVGKEVRTAIKKIGGTMPEDLPKPEKSIQQIEKEQIARLKAKAKKGKIMLDE